MLGVIRLLSFSGILRIVVGLLFDRRVRFGLKMIFPAAIVYIISPIDLIHDFLPLLGRVDDLIVSALAVLIFLGLAPRAVLMEHIRGRRSGADDSSAGSDPNVIEGQYRYDDEDPESKR